MCPCSMVMQPSFVQSSCFLRQFCFHTFRTLKDDQGHQCGQSLILEPVNIGLTITRNLAINWYQDKPETDIAGKLPAVTVSKGASQWVLS